MGVQQQRAMLVALGACAAGQWPQASRWYDAVCVWNLESQQCDIIAMPGTVMGGPVSMNVAVNDSVEK